MAEGKSEELAADYQSSIQNVAAQEDHAEAAQEDDADYVNKQDVEAPEADSAIVESTTELTDLTEEMVGLSTKLTDLTGEVADTAHGIKAQFLIEKASVLCCDSKYVEATEFLNNPDVPGSKLFMPRLLLVECHMHLMRLRRAKELIEALKKIAISSGLRPEEMKAYADDFLNGSFYARAIVLYRIASDLFRASSSPPDELVRSMYSCLAEINEAIKPLVERRGRSRKIAIKYGVEFMIEILVELKNVKNVSPESKAELEGLSCECIASSLYLTGDFVKSLEIGKMGATSLARQFRHRAVRYKNYGILLHRVGLAQHELGKFVEAEAYLIRAVDAIKSSKDFSDAFVKREFYEVSESDLKKTQEKLGKVDI